MNLEKVVFGFFIVLAATLNFGFFVGDITRPELHNVNELFAAIVVNLIATVLKFGDRTQIGAIHLATSLVADLQLIAAAIVWGRQLGGVGRFGSSNRGCEAAWILEPRRRRSRRGAPGGGGNFQRARPRYEIVNTCSDHNHNTGLLTIEADEADGNVLDEHN